MTGRPTAAPPMTRNSKGALCYPDHPSMAVVMRDEARERKRMLRAQIQLINARNRHDRERYERERRSVAG